MRRRNRALVVIVLAAAAVGCLLLLRARRRNVPPLQISFWYWSHPFSISIGEQAELRSLGVKRLFVHAADFERNGDTIRELRPQEWTGNSGGIGVDLVFHFDSSVTTNFERLSLSRAAAEICTAAATARTNVEEHGARVVGVQLDLDCPTRLLRRYADLTRRIRSCLASSRLALSITALPTWYSSSAIDELLDSVDFAAPQFYEAQTGRTLATFTPISDTDRMSRGLKAAARRGKAFYAGIPSYGHALLFRPNGEILGSFHDMDLPAALRSPAFRLISRYASDPAGKAANRAGYIGEQIYDLEAVQPDVNGEGRGDHLVYDVAEPAVLERGLEVIRLERPEECLGVILFRYPERRDVAALSLTTVAAALKHKPLKPSLRIGWTVSPSGRALVPLSNRSRAAPLDLNLRVTNIGAAQPLIAQGAVTVTLILDSPCVEELDPGQFELHESNLGGTMRSSLGRADHFVFTRSSLVPGESAAIGPIRVFGEPNAHFRVNWSVQAPGGFDEVRGSLPGRGLAAGSGEG